MFDLVLLFAAGVIGGALNSLAGGGSFIVFPALLLAGVPPVAANATNTFAALPGYLSGVWAFRRHMGGYRRQIVIWSLVALVGGWAGAELLLRVSDAQFSGIVPWLMAVAVFLFAFGGRIRAAQSKTSRATKHGTILMLGLLALVSLYGGFFNAGLGILWLAFFALAGLTNIHAMNGLKLWLSALVAIVAVIRFVAAGSIAWAEGSAAFVGTLVGGYLAARLAHHIPQVWLRNGIIAYGVGLTALFFWQAYF